MINFLNNSKDLKKLTNFKNGTCYISVDDLDLTDKEKTDPYNNTYNGGVVYENKKYVYKDADEMVPGLHINVVWDDPSLGEIYMDGKKISFNRV